MNKYDDTQIDVLLDLYFRDHARQTPWPAIAREMGLPTWDIAGLDDLLWKVITGYTGNKASGPRREYADVTGRDSRAGRKWYPREDAALRAALAGEGQLRLPPCDVQYIADVLARPVAEVEAQWQELHKDPLGREGFGF